jgi:serine/threonine protein kinase/WD40 repeat protein
MPDCPDDTELAGFLNESLPAELLGHVSGHVDGCARCQERLDRLTEQTSGGAVARYKELSSNVLQDSRSGGGAEENTLILGAKPGAAPVFTGLPRVPGFDVVAEIGRGGMGVVYKARHRRLNRLVALKMVLAGATADARIVQRFMFEGQVLARIQHPQVVQVFEVDLYQGPNGVPVPYLAMELLEGGSLSRKLRENATAPVASRWPAPRVAAELLEGLARAVHAAHLQGIVHRDLKPGNILFVSEVKKVETKKSVSGRHDVTTLLTDTGKPKVLDFGLAKFTREAGADLTQSGQVIGTPQYMAPEQAAGSKEIGPGADVYALGAILFECLAGRPPFTGGDPVSVLLKVVNERPPDVRTLQPGVPRDLAAVTMKCLEKDPARRYASAEALADDLARFLDNQPTRARPVRNPERVWLWAKRNPAIAGLLAALAVALIAAFALFAVLWMRAEQTAEDERDAKQRFEWSEKRARAEAENTRNALRETERQKARLEFDHAVASCEEGRVRAGLEQFLRGVQLAEQNGETDLARAARINLAAWPRDLSPAPRALAHKEQPRHVAFHPDGKRLVTAGRNGELFLWDIATEQKLRTYKPASRRFPGTVLTYWTVAISPDGNTIAAGGSDRAVTLWNIDSEEPAASFSALGSGLPIPGLEGAENLWSMGFTSNTVLWTNDGENGVKRWDLTAKPPRARVLSPDTKFYGDVVQILAVSADRTRVYTGDRKSTVREWDAEKLAEKRSWNFGNNWITDVAVSDDGAWLAATGPAGIVWTVDLITNRRGTPIPLAGAYGNGVAFAPKRPYLVASDGDGNVRFWHRETGQQIGIPVRFHGEVLRPRFRANSDEFAVPAGSAVYLCGLPDPPGDLFRAGHGLRARGLDFSPTGDRLAAIDEFTFELFDMRTRKPIQVVSGWEDNPLSLRFDPDPSHPFVYRGIRGQFSGGVERLAVPDGKKFEPAVSFGLGRVHRIDAARTGALFVMGETTFARFDRTSTAQVARKAPANDVPAGVTLNTLAVRPDGREILVSFANRVVFLDPDKLVPLREWRVGDELLDARYTPDGTKVLIGRRDNVAELLDATTGMPTDARPMPHTRAVTSVAVSPDGTLVLTGSRDGTARFWDAATGLPLGPPLRHAGPVTHVAFSPAGDRVATATGAGTVMVWGLPPAPANGSIAELQGQLKKP